MLIQLLLGAVSAVIFFIIAELFGRSKHVGRWWTFFLLWGGMIIPGVIALLLSPNANRKPFKGNVLLEMSGVVLAVFGTIGVIIVFAQWKNIDLIFINVAAQCLIVGLYLAALGKGNVINTNPRFYFQSNNKIKFRLFENSNEKFKVYEHHYFIREKDQTSIPLSFSELSKMKLNENTPVWRKGLENWVLAKDLAELEPIIICNPPDYINVNETD